MRRLDLDFRRIRPAAPLAGWLLLAACIAFALDLGRSYVAARAEIERQEAQLALGARAARGAVAPEATPEQMAAARETIRRLATPWGELFAALESTPAEGIALLEVAPDLQSASVVISGEARDYDAVVAYVAALRQSAPLARAYLARHELRRAPQRHPLAFSIRAPWSPGR